MSIYINCANCGRQVLINGPEDKCYWCGKNASKKEKESANLSSPCKRQGTMV